MLIDLSVIFAWVLLASVVPLCALMASRAWRIGIRRDFSRVALRGGRPPSAPARWASRVLFVNLLGALALLIILFSVLAGWPSFAQWAGAVGLVLWAYLLALWLIAQHAHRE